MLGTEASPDRFGPVVDGREVQDREGVERAEHDGHGVEKVRRPVGRAPGPGRQGALKVLGLGEEQVQDEEAELHDAVS
jgi:hypothetical protein